MFLLILIGIWRIGVIVDEENKIEGMAPLFDLNQALIAVKLGKDRDFDDLMYLSTNKSMKESVANWARLSDVEFLNLPEVLHKRMRYVERCRHLKSGVFA